MTPPLTLAQAMEAAKSADWMQVVLNQGPPCFHYGEEGRFCLRAQRWMGHTERDEYPEHRFISLADLLLSLPSAPQEPPCEKCAGKGTTDGVLTCGYCNGTGVASAPQTPQPEHFIRYKPCGCSTDYCQAHREVASAPQTGSTTRRERLFDKTERQLEKLEAIAAILDPDSASQLEAIDKAVGPMGLADIPLVERVVLMRQQNDAIDGIVQGYQKEIAELRAAQPVAFAPQTGSTEAVWDECIEVARIWSPDCGNPDDPNSLVAELRQRKAEALSTASAPPQGWQPPSVWLVCVDCGKATTALEASLRKFNEGRCGYCNGGFRVSLPAPPASPSEETAK